MMRIASVVLAAMTGLMAGIAVAEEDVAGKPMPGGLNTQRMVTELGHDWVWLDNFLLVVITLISLFVMALLVILIVRYNKKANPTPQTFTHNAVLEVVWTAVPVVILVIIAIPSLRLLDKQLEVPEADLTIKATGYQWFWDYEYPEEGITMSAFMLQEDELAEHGYEPDTYRLATDTRVVVPVGKDVHLLVTAGDVIHAWTVPSFGVKVDAIPGRMNELWFNVEEPGVYFGQCSELCGKDHAFMPITVEAMEEADYNAWVETQLAKQDGAETTEVAEAQAVAE